MLASPPEVSLGIRNTASKRQRLTASKACLLFSVTAKTQTDCHNLLPWVGNGMLQNGFLKFCKRILASSRQYDKVS